MLDSHHGLTDGGRAEVKRLWSVCVCESFGGDWWEECEEPPAPLTGLQMKNSTFFYPSSLLIILKIPGV